MGLNFEWDKNKAIANARKHGIGFEEAVTVFSDPLARIFYDRKHSFSEEREIIIGHSINHRLVLVCFTGRGKDAKPKLVNVTAAVHCNFCVNPRTVEAQVQGSAVMALGMTMPGEQITLKDGVVEQGNFHQYAVPRIGDAPTVAVHIVPSSDPPKGMGEPGLPPLAPAFANAVARLTGRRQRELPFRMA